MKRRTLAGVAAVLLFVSSTVFAAEETTGTQPGGGGTASMARLRERAAPIIIQAIAVDLKLSPEQAKKFRKAYVDEQAAAAKRLAKASESGDFAGVVEQNRKGLQAALESSLGPDQAKKVAPLFGMGGLEMNLIPLLQTDVEEARILKAMPVLIRYSRARGETFTRVQPGGTISRDSLRAKMQELRDKTAKELASIVGEDAADAWRKASMMGMGGARRGGASAGPGGGGRP